MTDLEVRGPGKKLSYFSSVSTGTFSRLRPSRKVSSMTQAAAGTMPPTCSSSVTAAAMVPPVASRSSISTTLAPFLIASCWISIVSVPYSSA
jgi:hypothetical protein